MIINNFIFNRFFFNTIKKKAIATGDSIVESLKRQRDLLESFRVNIYFLFKKTPKKKNLIIYH